jgi:SAM-dependent methyltransferase
LNPRSIGCGLGRITHALAQHFDESVGVDISEEMARRAQDLNADVPSALFVLNVANDLARFDDASFDLGVLVDRAPARSGSVDDRELHRRILSRDSS